MDTNNNSLLKFVRTVMERWLVAVSVVFIVAVIGVLLVWRASRTYSATAVLLVHSQQKNVIDIQSLQIVERINSTIAHLATQKSVISQVEQITGNIDGDVTAWPVRDTEFINITATDSSPQAAQLQANTTVDVLIDRVNWLQEKQPLGVTVEVVEKAVPPPIPSSTSKKVQAVGVVLFAVFAGLFSAGFAEALDRRVHEDDLHKELNLALVGKTYRFRKSHSGSLKSRDSFKQLQSTLQFLKLEPPVNAIGFTGTAPGEGKSSTVANLALAFNNVGQDVTVVDLDFRRPVMHKIFGIANNSKNGIGNIVVGTDAFPQPSQTQFKHIAVYPAGVVAPDDVARVYQSPRMRELTEMMHDKWLLVDLPPLLLVPGSAMATAICQNTIFVIEPSKTKLKAAKECIGILRRANVNIVGAILTKVRESGSSYEQENY